MKLTQEQEKLLRLLEVLQVGTSIFHNNPDADFLLENGYIKKSNRIFVITEKGEEYLDEYFCS